MNNTKFYRLLLKARYDETSLVLVINKIMPMINNKNYTWKSNLNNYSDNVAKDLHFYNFWYFP